MPKIKITNPRNVIEAPIKKNYFKIRATSGPKGDKGDTGATGPQGPQGPQGNAATIYVGSTTTLPVGQDATVENVGSQYAAVLNFGIPQGPQGPQGAKGDKGDKGDKGEQGNTGNTGPAGQNATVYIGTTTTGAPGSQASVYNSGTENNAVLNFTIPQGAKGDTGATGATGPQGPAGQDGKDFAPSVVDSLPAVGEENKLYLTPKAHTTQTATGNPITATITDGAGQIEDFQLDGDTYQQSYEGWNILDVDFESTTSYGVTKTLNADKTITLNGKINAGLNFTFGKDITFDTSSQYTLKVEVLRGSSTPYTNDGLPNHQWAVMVNMGLSSQGWQSYAVMCADDVTTVTFTPAQSTGTPRFWFGYNAPTADETTGIFNDYTLRISVKKGTTISGYEPFVGGIASPNPSYPQPIQVVTGEQTVSKVGKNLFDKNKALDNYFYTSTGSKSTYSKAQFCNNEFVPTGDKITMSFSARHDRQNGSIIEANVRIVQYDASGNFISRLMSRTNGYTFTLDANTKSFILCVDNGPDAWFDDLQVEYGSTATSYAPYHKQTLPISLGSIELCKLGSYQDYIYKDGDTWKVHKATATYTFDDRLLSWQRNTQISGGYVLSYNVNSPFYGLLAVGTPSYSSKCTHFTIQNNSTTWTGVGKAGFNSFGAFWCMTNIANIDDFLDWLDEDNPELFYPLATATDTEITDATLISQLNAIASASLETGTNTLTNSATGSNLVGDMEVDYFGYDPTNRYDKWLWLDINNAYEKLGS